MTRTQIKAIGIILFLSGIISVLYKVYGLNLPLIPQANFDSWKIEYNAEITRDRNNVDFEMPKIESRLYQRIEEIKTSKEMPKGDFKKGKQFSHKVEVRFSKKALHDNKSLQKYRRQYIESSDLAKLKVLYTKVTKGSETTVQKVKSITNYLNIEFGAKKSDEFDISNAIIVEEGTREERAIIFDALVKMTEVPARVVAGIDLDNDKHKKMSASSESNFTLVNQYLLDGRWRSVNISKDEYVVSMKRFFILDDNYSKNMDFYNYSSISHVIHVSPGTVSGLEKESYKKSVKNVSSFYTMLNLYTFRSDLQNFFFYILIIPFGALVLAICRNLIGIKTFGVFMPILLGLFLVSAGFWWGLAILFTVILLGLVERYVLDKFYLLAVPRLSIILTLIVMLFLVIGVLHTHFDMLPGFRFSGIPLVILAVFIERLSVQLLEEGLKKSLSPILGTFLIAVISYSLYQLLAMRVILFTHPELLVSIVGALIMIGSYHGYRLSEILRFKSFIEEA